MHNIIKSSHLTWNENTFRNDSLKALKKSATMHGICTQHDRSIHRRLHSGQNKRRDIPLPTKEAPAPCGLPPSDTCLLCISPSDRLWRNKHNYWRKPCMVSRMYVNTRAGIFLVISECKKEFCSEHAVTVPSCKYSTTFFCLCLPLLRFMINKVLTIKVIYFLPHGQHKKK